MDEREVKILGKDKNYFWFRAKDELLESLVDKESKVLNIGAGAYDLDWAQNYRGYANELDYKPDFFDYAILADVLEHIPPYDRQESLSCINNILKPGGKLIITVPAGEWLYNGHDRYLGHYNRYDKQLLKTEVEKAGFDTNYMRYWNSLMYPLAVTKKLLNKKNEEQSDFKKISKSLNIVLYKTLKLEERLNWLPFGITIVGEFEK